MLLFVIPAFAHCRPGKLLVDSADGYKVIKRFNLACRHSREGGNPSLLLHQSNVDYRLRGNDGQGILDLREKLSFFPEKRAFAGMTDSGALHFKERINVCFAQHISLDDSLRSSFGAIFRMFFALRAPSGLRRDDEQKRGNRAWE